MNTKERITEFTNRLISEGEELLANTTTIERKRPMRSTSHVDLRNFNKWITSFKLLLSMIGDLSTPWKQGIEGPIPNGAKEAEVILGYLESIKEAIDHDLLVNIGDLVFAEAFADLIDQAEYLFDQGYALASGVVLRAVLEERLKKLCDSNGCIFDKEKPTISDYNTKLYTTKVYDKITMNSVQTMAAVGNKAAHNEPDLDKDDVSRFKRDLVEFLQKFSA